MLQRIVGALFAGHFGRLWRVKTVAFGSGQRRLDGRIIRSRRRTVAFVWFRSGSSLCLVRRRTGDNLEGPMPLRLHDVVQALGHIGAFRSECVHFLRQRFVGFGGVDQLNAIQFDFGVVLFAEQSALLFVPDLYEGILRRFHKIGRNVIGLTRHTLTFAQSAPIGATHARQ